MRVAFHTFGCKVNQYETQALTELFVARGYVPALPGERAEVAVVNSCTVTAEGDRKTRQLLRRLRREHPGAVIVLTGCYPQAFPDEAALLDADVITGSSDRAGIVNRVEEFLRERRRRVAIAPHLRGEAFEPMHASGFGAHTRAFVKIEDGCENFCAYCIIPTARGPVRSKDPEALRGELEGLVASGYREVVLAGINLSSYGRDLGLRLTDAVRIACGVPGLERVRLGSLEPDLTTPEEIDRLAEAGKVCPQFHLSLQSGSDGTLRRMGRRYTTEEYLGVVNGLRAAFPNAAITTDLMVGFAGETEREFCESEAFARRVGFAKIHVFPYSRRPGTRADRMPDQVAQEEKKRRAAHMLETAAQLRRTFLAGMVGRVEPVLFEDRNQAGQTGYTPNYTPVTVLEQSDLRGKVCPVRITAAGEDSCLGELDHGGGQGD